MIRISKLFFCLGMLLAPNPFAETCVAALPKVHLTPAFPHLQFERPVWMTHANDGSNRLFLVEQAGLIHVFANDPSVKKSSIFLDLRSKTGVFSNEEGALCMAFHPHYKANGKFYVYYCAQNPRRTVLSEFRVSPSDPDRANPSSERVLMEIPQPFSNHKGSTTLFGPDGFLYFSLGDGGSGGDPYGNGQNLKVWLAKILRIDVDQSSENLPYGIPSDNPLVDRGPRVRKEIWAYGLRNVWRMSFDRKTGDLWGGDVGQDRWEEIDLIRKGGNYGWNYREGKHPFKGTPPSGLTLVDPVVDYGRKEGTCVVGGYVYRGKKFPDLEGIYLYADYTLGTIWGLRYENGRLLEQGVLLEQPNNISSFAEDADGELHVLAFDGQVYRIEIAP